MADCTNQRVQDLQLTRTYALVFCATGSFGLLRTDENVTAALRSCHDAPDPWSVRMCVESARQRLGVRRTEVECDERATDGVNRPYRRNSSWTTSTTAA